MAVGPLLDSFTGFTDWHGKRLRSELSYRQMRRYLNLSRAVFSYRDFSDHYSTALAWTFWLSGWRTLTEEPNGFEKELDDYFRGPNGEAPVEVVAEVVKITCASYTRLKWTTRASLLFLLGSGLALLNDNGAVLGGFFIYLFVASALNLVFFSWRKCVFIELLNLGDWWSVRDRRFVNILFGHGDELMLQEKLRGELAGARGGLGLTGNGYEIINALAPDWGSTLSELIDSVNSLSR